MSTKTTELAEESVNLTTGLGLLTVTLFGAVPGFLPCVALIVVGLAIVAIPMLIVGAAAAVVAAPLMLIFRISKIARRGPAAPRPGNAGHADPAGHAGPSRPAVPADASVGPRSGGRARVAVDRGQ